MTTEQTNEDTLYSRLKAAGLEMDHHESDLYVRDTPEAREIIKAYREEGKSASPEYFRGTDGQRWIDLPFHYEPFWKARDRSEAAPENVAPKP